MVKYCRKCKKETPRYTRSDRPTQGDCVPCALGRHQRNKAKVAPIHAAWMKVHRSSEQQKQNVRRHGLTMSQFEAMHRGQDGKCACCRREFLKTPHIDHDHGCCPGRYGCEKCVRGLLCAPCNHLLGRFKDSIDLFYAFTSYLRGYQRRKICQTLA